MAHVTERGDEHGGGSLRGGSCKAYAPAAGAVEPPSLAPQPGDQRGRGLFRVVDVPTELRIDLNDANLALGGDLFDQAGFLGPFPRPAVRLPDNRRRGAVLAAIIFDVIEPGVPVPAQSPGGSYRSSRAPSQGSPAASAVTETNRQRDASRIPGRERAPASLPSFD